MTSTKKAVMVVGLVMIVAALPLLMIAEPAGGPGSPYSGGTSDVSDKVYPYLIPALVLIAVGAVVLAIAALGKV
jgi:hypothetical protein